LVPKFAFAPKAKDAAMASATARCSASKADHVADSGGRAEQSCG
jgi:hypothetical protein